MTQVIPFYWFQVHFGMSQNVVCIDMSINTTCPCIYSKVNTFFPLALFEFKLCGIVLEIYTFLLVDNTLNDIPIKKLYFLDKINNMEWRKCCMIVQI